MMNFSKIGIILALILGAVSTNCASAQVGELQRATPASQGVSSQSILNMVDSLMANPATELHHLMVLRHGKVIAEAHPTPFAPTQVHTLFSCSKTVTSIAVGMAISENRLRLTDRVATFFPDKLPDSISDNLAAMTVRDLLTMSSGIRADLNITRYSRDWMRDYLAKPVEVPGARFRYDSQCTFTLSAILQRITGERIIDYLRPRLFEPLGISTLDWEESPDGINVGGWGLRMQTESMAKIGQLILQKGRWNGKQLIPEDWVEQMTAKQIEWNHGKKPMDTNQGYCYHMWRCLLPGASRADGAYGQFIVIMPEQDMVVAMNGYSSNTASELRAIWNQLVPGISTSALTTDPAAKKLGKRLATLSLPLPQGSKWNLKHAISLRLPDNDRNIEGLTIVPTKQGCKVEFAIKNVENKPTAPSISQPMVDNNYNYTLEYKAGGWAHNSTKRVPPYLNGAVAYDTIAIAGIGGPFEVAANCATPEPGKIVLTNKYVDWISTRTITIECDPKSMKGTPCVLRVTLSDTARPDATLTIE